MKILSIGTFLYAIILMSCSPQPEGTNAEISEAKEVKDVMATATYKVNLKESTVTWIGSKPTGRHNGSIPISSGEIYFDDNKVVGGTIQMDILNIANKDLSDKPNEQQRLLNHLKSKDFFDAENFPTAKFVITSIAPYDPSNTPEVKEEFETEYTPATADKFIIEKPTHMVTGNLTMRGTTLGISFPAEIISKNNQVLARAKFNIDRTLWGLKYRDEADVVDRAKDKFIYNTVNVAFDLLAGKSPDM